MEATAKTWNEYARQFDLTFDGFQKLPGGIMAPMFTGKKVGTFVINENETLESALERKHKQFFPPPPPPEPAILAAGQTEQLKQY